MKKNNIFYIIIALVVVSLGYLMFTTDIKPTQKAPQAEKPKPIVYGGTIKEENGGSLVWEIKLDEMKLDNISGTAEAKGIKGKLIRSDGSTILLYGDTAHIDIARKDVTLNGNVRANISTGETLKAKTLSWKRSAQEITVSGDAVLTQGNLVARADKIVADQKIENIKLIGNAQVDRGIIKNEIKK